MIHDGVVEANSRGNGQKAPRCWEIEMRSACESEHEADVVATMIVDVGLSIMAA